MKTYSLSQVLGAALLTGTVLFGTVVTTRAAHSQGINIGVGAPIGNTGINVGTGYRFGSWNSRFQTGVFLDAGRYLNRRPKNRGSRDGRQGRAEQVLSENLKLKVSPKEAWVYVNGQRIYADGRSELTIPPGKYRFEFVRPGYRTEVADLTIIDGIDFRVERKMEKLSKGEPGDPRFQNPGQPIPALDAFKPMEAAKSGPKTVASTPAGSGSAKGSTPPESPQR